MITTMNIDKMLRASYSPNSQVLSLMKVSGREIIINNVVNVMFEDKELSVSFYFEGVKKSIIIGGALSKLSALPGYWVQSFKIVGGE